jgi:hypothetical protein
MSSPVWERCTVRLDKDSVEQHALSALMTKRVQKKNITGRGEYERYRGVYAVSENLK